LKVFENRVPRKIFGAKRDEVTGDWRKLPSEELHDCIPFQIYDDDQIEKNGLVHHVGRKLGVARVTSLRWETPSERPFLRTLM
jgi:hypothetical protein